MCISCTLKTAYRNVYILPFKDSKVLPQLQKAFQHASPQYEDECQKADCAQMIDNCYILNITLLANSTQMVTMGRDTEVKTELIHNAFA